MKKRAEKKITVLPSPKRIMEKNSSVMPLLFKSYNLVSAKASNSKFKAGNGCLMARRHRIVKTLDVE